MRTVPVFKAVTVPFSSIVATDTLLEDHVTLASVASEGDTVAVRVSVLPFLSVVDGRFIVTAVGDTSVVISVVISASAAFTVTAQEAVSAPSAVLTVIVAIPAPTAVTMPALSTVATDSSLDDHIRLLSMPSDNGAEAVSVSVSPALSVMDALSRASPTTGVAGLIPGVENLTCVGTWT